MKNNKLILQSLKQELDELKASKPNSSNSVRAKLGLAKQGGGKASLSKVDNTCRVAGVKSYWGG